MPLHIFTCTKDPILNVIRETFKATPLAIPDSSTAPLEVIAHRGRRTFKSGPLQDLLAGHPPLQLESKTESIAPILFGKQQHLHAQTGIEILSNLLKGFGIGEIPLDIGLHKEVSLGFDFPEVHRKTIALTSLGKALQGKNIDPKNLAADLFLRDKRPFNLLLISSVYLSKSFHIYINKGNQQELGVELSALEQALGGKIKFDISQSGNQQKLLSFEGDEPLAFAFSCVELGIRPDHTLTLGAKVNPNTPRSSEEEYISFAGEEFELEEQSLMDYRAPAMVIWDD